jgi:hypothetical protein
MLGWTALLAAGVLGWATLVAGSIGDVAKDGRTIVVTQDGSGDATTIAAGVRMAVDGDTVLVRPGTYRERVDVQADIAIRGDGPRERVIVEALDGQGQDHHGTPRSVAFTFRGSFGSLSNLTVRGAAGGRAISVEAEAAPVISDVTIGSGGVWTGRNVAIWWSSGATGVLRDSTVSGLVGVAGAGTSPLIESNRLTDACITVRSEGSAQQDQPRPVIRDNSLGGCPTGVLIRIEAGSPLVEGNDLVLEHGTGVSLAGSGGTVRGNTIHDSETAVSVANPRGPVAIEDNAIDGNSVGVSVFNGDTGVRIERNHVQGNGVALNLAGGEPPVISDNTLCGNAADITVVPVGHDVPSLDGNGGCQASGWFPGA